MTTTRETVTDRSGQRYTEQQLVEILRRAAERQEGLTTEPDGRFSLAEIQQIASEVGIAPARSARPHRSGSSDGSMGGYRSRRSATCSTSRAVRSDCRGR